MDEILLEIGEATKFCEVFLSSVQSFHVNSTAPESGTRSIAPPEAGYKTAARTVNSGQSPLMWHHWWGPFLKIIYQDLLINNKNRCLLPSFYFHCQTHMITLELIYKHYFIRQSLLFCLAGCRSVTSCASSTAWRSATWHLTPCRMLRWRNGALQSTRASGGEAALPGAAGTTQVHLHTGGSQIFSRHRASQFKDLVMMHGNLHIYIVITQVVALFSTLYVKAPI